MARNHSTKNCRGSGGCGGTKVDMMNVWFIHLKRLFVKTIHQVFVDARWWSNHNTISREYCLLSANWHWSSSSAHDWTVYQVFESINTQSTIFVLKYRPQSWTWPGELFWLKQWILDRTRNSFSFLYGWYGLHWTSHSIVRCNFNYSHSVCVWLSILCCSWEGSPSMSACIVSPGMVGRIGCLLWTLFSGAFKVDCCPPFRVIALTTWHTTKRRKQKN